MTTLSIAITPIRVLGFPLLIILSRSLTVGAVDEVRAETGLNGGFRQDHAEMRLQKDERTFREA